jgi:small-conductance mechanosensitive channel
VTGSFEASSVLVASIIIVVLPALIIGVGELEERLRQRDSSLRPSVAILRIWVVPLAAVWMLVRTLFDVPRDNVFVRLLASVLVLAIAAALLSAFRVVVARIADHPRRSGDRAVPRLVLAVPRLLIILVAAWLLIAGVWGVDLSAALTALGVTSLVISFALQDTLGGIASGFTLLADQPFSAGDWIESEDVEGRVIDVNWRSTRIENRDGDLVVIPNGQLAKATIVNFDQPTRLHRVMVQVQIERTAPPTAAKAMLIEAARSTAGVLAEPPPVVFVTNIADPIVDYNAYMWIDDFAITPRVKADFASLVWYLSYRHGVPLPNPAQDLYLFDGVKSAIESQVSSADVRQALLGTPLFAEVADDVLDHLAATSSIDTYQDGEVIIAAGDVRDLHVLDAGRAHLVLRTSDLGDLDVLDHATGELLGVLGELQDSTQHGVVVAVGDCRVVRIPADAAATALTSSSALAAALEQLRLSRRRRCDRVVRRAQRLFDPTAGPLEGTS